MINLMIYHIRMVNRLIILSDDVYNFMYIYIIMNDNNLNSFKKYQTYATY